MAKALTARQRVNRLTKLRDFIAGLPPAKFDMGTFISPKGNTPQYRQFVKRDEPLKVSELLHESCGTRACVAGWAVLLFDSPSHKISYDGIEFRASDLLGIDGETSSFLFSPGDGPMRGKAAQKAAIKDLNQVIANKGEYPKQVDRTCF